MNTARLIRSKLRELGFQPHMDEEMAKWGLQLTVCQLIVMFFSVLSVVFLFVPLLYLQDIKFMLVFYSFSLFCIGAGIWFWMHKNEICEHPEEYQE